MEEIREYAAFISYRHKELDKYVAKKIHTMIERYTVPKEMRESWGGKKLGKVFRDEEELPVSSNLTESICTALDHTQFLIVICTPDTPESIWVEREIKYFLEHHDRNRLVAVLVDGTPDTSFPKLLTTIYDENGNEIGKIEPLAANLTGVDNRFRKNRLKKEAVRLYAAIMGCPFDSLWQREKRYKLYRMLALVSILAIAAIVYGTSIYIKNRRIQEQNDEINEQLTRINNQKTVIESQLSEIEKKNDKLTEQNEEIENQNKEITENNKLINAQNEKLELSEAQAYIEQGELMLEKGDMNGAAKSAIHAINTERGKSAYADEAEYVLSRALGALNYENTMRTEAVIEQDENIKGILLSKDKGRIFTTDVRNSVRCFNAETGEMLWQNETRVAKHNYVTNSQRLVELEKYGILLYCGEDVICAFSIENGKEVWRVDCGNSTLSDFWSVSKDQSKVALLIASAKDFSFECDYILTILDSQDGHVEKSVPVTETFKEKGVKAAGACSGVFSDDGKKLFGMLYYADTLFLYKGYCIFCYDIDTEEIKILAEADYEEIQNSIEYCPFVIGIDYIAEKNSILIAHYSSSDASVYVEEYSEDGNKIAGYAASCPLPKKEYNGEYKTTFKRSEDEYLFSCETMAFSYNIVSEDFRNIDGDFGSRIYSISCLDSEQKSYSFITEDGLMHIIWPKVALSSRQFFDKTAITYMDISDGAISNTTGLYGIKLDESAVAVAVSITEAGKAYILRPNKDSDFEEAGWYDALSPEHSSMKAPFKLEYAGNGKIALWEVDKDNPLIGLLTIINAQSGEVEESYKIDTEDKESFNAEGMIRGARLWPDCEHFTCYLGTQSVGFYDLKKGEYLPAFDEAGAAASSYSEIKEEKAVQAIICRKDEKVYSGSEYEIRYRIGDGDIISVSEFSSDKLVSGNGLLKKGFIKAGENGQILAVLFDEEKEGKVDSFAIINTENGASKVIAYEGEDYLTFGSSGDAQRNNLQIALGKENAVFVTMGADNKIKVFDSEAGTQTNEFLAGTDLKDVSGIELFYHDTKLAVWTRARRLYIYDLEAVSGTENLLSSVIMNSADSSEINDTGLEIVEDLERKRVFFAASNKAVICLGTDKWKKQADFYGFDAFCPETNEIFRVKNNNIRFVDELEAIIKVKAYTLEDLKKKAENNG